SRRRHTRFSRDWSSDVCSSDLTGKLVLTQLREIGTGTNDPPRTWPLKTGQHHEERRFAGAGGTDKTRRLALGDPKINALENIDRPRSARQAEFHAVEFDDCVGQKIAFPVVLSG